MGSSEVNHSSQVFLLPSTNPLSIDANVFIPPHRFLPPLDPNLPGYGEKGVNIGTNPVKERPASRLQVDLESSTSTITKDMHPKQPHSFSDSDSRALDMSQLKSLILAAGKGEVAQAIKEAKFLPRHNAFTSLLQLASKSRQPEKAIEIFEAMQDVSGIEPNTYTYSALISALARVGKWEEAEKYFDELKQKAEIDPSMNPNTVTYAAMISAYEKGCQLDKALATFQEQLDRNIVPDVITYASLLSACERAGDLDRAVTILDSMHAEGLVGPQQLYHNVIAACGACWRPALDTFLGMQCAGVEASAQSINLLMASLCAGGQRNHALVLLQQSSLAGIILSRTAYNALLRLLSQLGDWGAAESVYFNHICATHAGMVDPLAAGYVIAALTTGRDLDSAVKMRNYFKKMGIEPSFIHHGRQEDSLETSTSSSVNSIPLSMNGDANGEPSLGIDEKACEVRREVKNIDIEK